jgi:CubicO group peptidase (beta-lactamase class C family)
MNTSALTSVLGKIVSGWKIPGMAVGIVSADEILYSACWGVQSLATHAPVTPDSVFCVSSMSKSFVAAAIMQLVERGKMDLDSPLVRYLPYFRLDDPRYAAITIRQLLCHISGMPDMNEDDYVDLIAKPETDEGAPERYVRWLSNLKLDAAPGERFQYSNIGFNILGDSIAKVTGTPFETALKSSILNPVGMASSSFLPTEVPLAHLAAPHLRVPERISCPFTPYHRADAPASFLHASLSDMCCWLQTCLNRGRRILSPARLESMWTPAAHRGYPPLQEDYGLGWNLGHCGGYQIASHGGMGFGWTSFMGLLPGKNCAGVILCNEESFAHLRAVDAVIAAMLERDPQPGTISWLIPICQALGEGGIQAAHDCYEQIKRDDSASYVIEENDLINLTNQLSMVGKIDQVIEVLQLNLRAFPNSIGTLWYLAKYYQRQGKSAQAEECRRKIQVITSSAA